MAKQYTEDQLREKGYVPANEASVTLVTIADQLQHEDQWVKVSLQLWYQTPKGEQR